jgi:hypothetical protein
VGAHRRGRPRGGLEERAHAALDAPENFLYVLLGWAGQRQEANGALVADPYAIGDGGMDDRLRPLMKHRD